MDTVLPSFATSGASPSHHTSKNTQQKLLGILQSLEMLIDLFHGLCPRRSSFRKEIPLLARPDFDYLPIKASVNYDTRREIGSSVGNNFTVGKYFANAQGRSAELLISPVSVSTLRIATSSGG